MANTAKANNMERKHLSSIANDVIRRCAQELDSSVGSLVEEFEGEWEPQMGGYSKKLVEFCCSRALTVTCGAIDETISDGSFSRFTFDMMLAWEMPSSADEESHTECVAKEKEEKKVEILTDELQDDVSLFYSDLMPLLVDREPSAGEDAFVWLGTLVPLVGEMVNGRFTFETLTAPTGNRLHFPAYDKFLKEIHRCIKHLQKQETPTGVELADDEFILHVEGTANSQRVVRHIGGTSWPGRLTLTNYALYFEASSIMSYEDALKLDLSKDIEQSVKPAATGPWGAPLFDKAIVYESSELDDKLDKTRPLACSRKGDYVTSPVSLEVQGRIGTTRDYVLQELAENLKRFNGGHPCSASSILRNLSVSQPCAPCLEPQQISENIEMAQLEDLSSLASAINQRERKEKKLT
ncbi:hypothetical protein DH2020_026513 [Rehmannia glutinosa]|uniref:Uncharacterized protein n=1 Tax=Rehmannia glutinosa TaxID=99300 RepID=A0ABR0VWV1_REHGL